ncbi:MAG: hypothetical protein ACJAZ3_001741 [Sphingobacteriales bacterium]|jgi:hypothetical protein
MRLPSFFKTSNYHRFDYTPLYYDERKEDLEKRVRKIKREIGEEVDENLEKRISNINFRSQSYQVGKAKRQSSFRLIIIIIGLMLAAYFLLF